MNGSHNRTAEPSPAYTREELQRIEHGNRPLTDGAVCQLAAQCLALLDRAEGAERERDEDRQAFAVVNATLAECRRECTELRAVVEKLPILGDGVRGIPHMKVFRVLYHNRVIEESLLAGEWTDLGADDIGPDWWILTRESSGWARDYFSTRAAALAARQQAEKGGGDGN